MRLSLNPYLFLSLILLFACLAGIYLLAPYRRAILIAAILSIPAAASEILFIPEYWTPLRLTDFTIGIEDIIFSFSTGGIAWIIVCLIFGTKISYSIRFRRIFMRYSALVMLGLTLLFITHHYVRWGVMNEALLGISIVGFILMTGTRFRLWKLTAAGSFLLALYYFINLLVTFSIFPEFASSWNTSNLWNIFVFKIPLEEIAWAFALGAVWPVAMAYVLDAKLLPGTKSKPL